MKRVVAVAGSAACSVEEAALAYDVGRLLAERDVVVACGGLAGVTEATCKGAHEAGGVTIGILPHDRALANPYVNVPITTGLGEARNLVVAKVGPCEECVDDWYETIGAASVPAGGGRARDLAMTTTWEARAYFG